MGQLDRIRDSRRAVQHDALKRWLARSAEREHNKAEIQAGGVGAADSPQRNARFRERQAGLAQARKLSQAGLLPFGIERRMGPTLDYSPFAPSDAARTAGRPVARIVAMVGAGHQPDGFATGFLIGSNLLMTNHHVFATGSDAVGIGANFLFERTERGLQTGITFELAPDAFFVSDERLDFAIVGVKPSGSDARTLNELGVITLIEATPKILKGQPVNIIQHPDGGPKQYAVLQNRLVDILDQGFLHYETDTLEGSSGSPAFSQSWELVALHHASIPATRDGRPLAISGEFWEESMGDDRVRWIANEGARVSAIVSKLSGIALDNPDQQAILRGLLATTTDPVDDLARQVPGLAASESVVRSLTGGVPGGGVMANNQFNFSGPVAIHVYAPGRAELLPATQPETPPAPVIAVPEAAIRFDPNYADREGYDPAFLDPDGTIRVPVPTVASDRLEEIVKNRQDEPLILKYHHFELLMNAVRRLQMWSAVNVDYAPERKLKGDRKSFGSDKWIADRRIPGELQLLDAEFYKPAGNIDRGHIVRREDNAWGDSGTEIEFANSDTFHWTNCTPQHEAFNQSTPGRNDATYRGMAGLWGDFENYLQQSRKGADTKACILAGPVLDNDNDPSADFGLGEVQYPLRFWKVVAVVEPEEQGAASGRELKVFGFILSQKPVVDRFGIETFGPGRFKRYQVSLTTITEETGVVFDDALIEADTLRGETDAIRVSSLDQVRGVSGRAARSGERGPPVP